MFFPFLKKLKTFFHFGGGKSEITPVKPCMYGYHQMQTGRIDQFTPDILRIYPEDKLNQLNDPHIACISQENALWLTDWWPLPRSPTQHQTNTSIPKTNTVKIKYSDEDSSYSSSDGSNLLINVNSDYLFECPHKDCTKIFTRRHNLKVHYNSTHLKVKLFACSICSKNFSRKFDCSRHVKNVHRGAVPPVE